MPLRDIAVFIDACAGDELRLAAGLAHSHGASLTGIYLRSRSWSHASYVRGPLAIQDVIERQLALEGGDALRCCRLFGAVAAQYGVRSSFRVICDDIATDDAALCGSLCVDMAVVGRRAGQSGREVYALAQPIAAAGVPLLVVPSGCCAEAPRHIAIVWKASKQDRTAVALAMPLLERAKRVTILMIDPRDEQISFDIVRHLDCYGVKAAMERIHLNSGRVVDAVLASACERDIDLLVIGSLHYPGPFRVFNRTIAHAVLKKSKLPVLMSG